MRRANERVAIRPSFESSQIRGGDREGMLSMLMSILEPERSHRMAWWCLGQVCGPKLHMHIVSPSWIWLKQRWSKSPQTTWGFRRDFFPEHFLSSETRNCCCFSANGACNWRALCRTWSLSFAHVHTIIYILFIICTLTSVNHWSVRSYTRVDTKKNAQQRH